MNTIKVKERLKKLRKKNGYTHKALAEMIPTDRSNYTRWENTNNDILPVGLKFYERIADIYGVSIDYILCRDDIPQESKFEISKVCRVIQLNAEHILDIL